MKTKTLTIFKYNIYILSFTLTIIEKQKKRIIFNNVIY